MTRYRQGYRFELRVKADMESRGWWVIRAAGSHGPADLVCLKAGDIITWDPALIREDPDMPILGFKAVLVGVDGPAMPECFREREVQRIQLEK